MVSASTGPLRIGLRFGCGMGLWGALLGCSFDPDPQMTGVSDDGGRADVPLPRDADSTVDGGLDAGRPADGGPDSGTTGDLDGGLDGGTTGELDGGAPDSGPDSGPGAGVDAAVSDAGMPIPSFSYRPSNFAPERFAPRVDVEIDCDAEISVEANVLAFTAWCPGSEKPEVHSSTTGLALILAMRSLTITGGGSLTIVGPTPLIFAVYGDARLEGPVRSNGHVEHITPETGCPESGQGGPGDEDTRGGGGGGGGAFGANGGQGGMTNSAEGGTAGEAPSLPSLIPLRTGCPGGAGGDGNIVNGAGGAGGAAGGAFQISAAEQVRLASSLSANGAGGLGGNLDAGGGGGGGGGGILVEGWEVVYAAADAWLTANGGGGGGGGNDNFRGAPGEPGLETSDQPAAGGTGAFRGNSGGPGGAAADPQGQGGKDTTSTVGAGGGGGSVGRIEVRAFEECTVLHMPRFSPSPSASGGSFDCTP